MPLGWNSYSGECTPELRNRELFPLPKCADVPREQASEQALSISSRRRKAKVRQNVALANSIIEALNEMYSPSPEGDFCSSGCTAVLYAIRNFIRA